MGNLGGNVALVLAEPPSNGTNTSQTSNETLMNKQKSRFYGIPCTRKALLLRSDVCPLSQYVKDLFVLIMHLNWKHGLNCDA